MRLTPHILVWFFCLTIVACDGGILPTVPVVVETVAGSGTSGDTSGPGTAAEFNMPDGVTIREENASDVAYITDMGNNEIKRIDGTGEVTLISGMQTPGFVDGPADTAQFNTPDGITTDSSGNIYVADTLNNAIRKIDLFDQVTTIAGGGPEQPGSADGTGTAALFNGPTGITVDSSGNIYVADQGNDAIRKITPEGVVTTVVGNADTPGFVDGPPAAAQLNEPHGLAIDAAGDLYTTEWGNNAVRKIDMSNGEAVSVSTLVGTGTAGDTVGTTEMATLDKPHGVTVSTAGEVFVADENNNKIKAIDTAQNTVSTYAGTGDGGYQDGNGSNAKFKSPRGLALGVYKNTDLFVCDYNNNRVRKIAQQP